MVDVDWSSSYVWRDFVEGIFQYLKYVSQVPPPCGGQERMLDIHEWFGKLMAFRVGTTEVPDRARCVYGKEFMAKYAAQTDWSTKFDTSTDNTLVTSLSVSALVPGSSLVLSDLSVLVFLHLDVWFWE